MSRPRPQRARWPWLAGYWLLMAVGSHLPQESAAAPILGHDKLVHFAAFAVLAWLLAWWDSGRAHSLGWRRAGQLFAILIAYGIADELTQPYFGRSCDIFDLVADALGSLTGLAVFAKLQSRGQR